LQVPIFDTGLAWISDEVMAVSTGYGFVRTYDKRIGAKCRMNAEILKNEMMVTHLAKSLVNEH
jgi:hypothetical protein